MLSLEQLVSYAEKLEKIIDVEVKNEFKTIQLGDMISLKYSPDKLKQILDPHCDNLYRCGVKSTAKINKTICNVSLINSVLSCIIDNFFGMIEDNKQIYINTVVETLIEDYLKRKKDPDYWINTYGLDEAKISATNFVKNVRSYKYDSYTLQLLSTYFFLNIYIFDSEGNVYVIYGGKKLNRHSMSVLLCKIDNYYEPIFYQQHKLIDPNNELIQSLHSHHQQHIKRILPYKDKTLFKPVETGLEDLNNYVPEEPKSNNEYTELNDTHEVDELEDGLTVTEQETDSLKDSSGLFYKKKQKTLSECKTTVPISLKMKLGELQKIAQQHKISITSGFTKTGKKKMKTKAVLYDEIVDAIGL